MTTECLRDGDTFAEQQKESKKGEISLSFLFVFYSPSSIRWLLVDWIDEESTSSSSFWAPPPPPPPSFCLKAEQSRSDVRLMSYDGAVIPSTCREKKRPIRRQKSAKLDSQMNGYNGRGLSIPHTSPPPTTSFFIRRKTLSKEAASNDLIHSSGLLSLGPCESFTPPLRSRVNVQSTTCSSFRRNLRGRAVILAKTIAVSSDCSLIPPIKCTH